MNGQVQRLQKVDHGATYNDNDNDNDHSSSQLRVHKALTCPEGQSAWGITRNHQRKLLNIDN